MESLVSPCRRFCGVRRLVQAVKIDRELPSRPKKESPVKSNNVASICTLADCCVRSQTGEKMVLARPGMEMLSQAPLPTKRLTGWN
jgi:hypothetical protein